MLTLQKASPETIKQGVALLKSGRPVSFPTDTVYALGAPVNDIECVRRVYDIKQRPLNMALPILLASVEDVRLVAMEVSETAETLMKEFWPGALTLIFKKTPFVPDIVTAGGQTIAVRIAAHPVAFEIVKQTGVPLVGTSANVHSKPSPVTADEVMVQIGNRVQLIIDAGKTPGGFESTIVDVSTNKPRILRQGALSQADIERFCRLF